MLFTKQGSLITSKFIWVDTNYTHEEPIGWAEAQWVQICSIPDRAWGLNVIFREGGMLYRNVPPWAISFWPDGSSLLPEESQMWNCYSDQFTILECPHLLGRKCEILTCNGIVDGEYLFQTTHLNDSYSTAPDQDKTMIWAVTTEGRLTIYPNNRVYFKDRSYILESPPKRLKLHEQIYEIDESISTIINR